MRQRNRLWQSLAVALSAALILVACGGDDEGSTDDAPESTDADGGDDADAGDDAAEELSISDMTLAYPSDRASMLMGLIGAQTIGGWDDDFDSVELVATEQAVSALVSGSAWIVMHEPAALWPALEEGVVDGVLVANVNDHDNWYLCGDADIQEPEDLIGAKYTGGEAGNAWAIVGSLIMEELGIDPAEVEFVSVGGSTDQWIEALMAGQVDASQCQPRHLPLIEEAGFNVLYQEHKTMATEMLMVTRETWENNQDAVCAVVDGFFEHRQWIQDAEEENWIDKMPEVEAYLQDAGYDTGPDGLNIENVWETTQFTEFSWAMDMGAPVEAWDLQHTLLGRPGGEVSADFDWRDYAEFDCVWAAQEAAGLPLNPDPDSL